MNILVIILIAVSTLVFVFFVRNAISSYQEYLCGQKRPGEVRKGPLLYEPDSYTGSKLASNVSVFIQRRITKEHVYTNDMGFRIEKPGLIQKTPVDIVFLGCSTVMGVGVEYETTFVSKISKIQDVNVANLGVGSHGLQQFVRNLEKNVKDLKPSMVVLCYGHGHTDRAFKVNAFASILRRPIYVYHKNKDTLIIREPKYNPPVSLVNKLSDLMMYPNIPHIFSFKDIILYMQKEILMKYVTIRNGALLNLFLNKLGLKKWQYADSSLEKNRRRVIFDAVQKLNKLSKEFGFAVLIHNYFPYSHFDFDVNEKKQEVSNRLASIDTGLFQEAINITNADNIFYEAPDLEKELYDDWMHNNGFDEGHYKDAFHLPDNNHPNEIGHSIIAESIVKQLKKYSVI